MSPLTLTLKEIPRQRVDLSPLTPEALAGMNRNEITALELSSGNRKIRVAELFELSGEDAGNLIIKNSCDKLDRIGQGMSSGSIQVRGNAGTYLGLGMKNGAINVHGHAGVFAASGMKGGLICIHGDAGDFLAAAIPGDRHGMKGGTVIITGSAGDRVGDHMRRGNVLIEGNVGNYCGSRMLAGTIAVLGKAGSFTGYGMKRGTLLLSSVPAMPATFNDCGVHDLNYLPLLIKSWQSLDSKFAKLTPHARVRRHMGDLASAGKGEILVFVN
ncbi:MAG TPA: formylmethanofuran dehydrogenase subunit C [Burkholderiales bacterium]|nr:formylmethanofuran dehydrogenase subunit C [Burkholderiales bacterium]